MLCNRALASLGLDMRWRCAGWIWGCVLAGTAFGADVRQVGSDLRVNGVAVFSVSSNQVGAIQARLANAGAGTPVSVSGNKRSARVIVAGFVIKTISRSEAKAARVAPRSLAESYASRLRSALKLGVLELPAEPVRVPAGGFVKLDLRGSKAFAFAPSIESKSIASSARLGQTLVLTGRAPGQTTVKLSVGSLSKTVPVVVQPYAVQTPQAIEVRVTGDPASPSHTRGAVEAALRYRLKGVSGYESKFSVPPLGALGANERRSIQIPISATGQNAFDQKGMVTVNLINQGMKHLPEAELWYCNDPESVKSPGPLFRAHLELDRPARLLYHHINESNSDLFMQVQVVNESAAPAKIMLIPGDAPPDPNPVKAGLDAAERFLRERLRYSGEIIELPAKSALPISLRRLSKGDTMSGLCYLRLLTPTQGVMVRTDASRPFSVSGGWAEAFRSATPWRQSGFRALRGTDSQGTATTEHVYPEPFRLEEATYRVGGKFTFVRIGQEAIARADLQSVLEGNFGVIYTIRAKMENPQDAPANVEIVFEASAGYSGALFVVDGQLMRKPLLQPKEEAKLAKVRLMPGAQKTLTLTTVPLSGSSYPATLVVRPEGSSQYGLTAILTGF